MIPVELIHLEIDPLFLDDLRAEFEQSRSDRDKLTELRSKISELKFFEPTGSDEFLKETYDSLQQLEREINEAIGSEEGSMLRRENFYGVVGNPLQQDWKKLVPEVDYIIGSPPTVSMITRTKDQKSDIVKVFRDKRNRAYAKIGKLDYAACWYFKTAQFVQGTRTRAAFVSISSVCHGEQAYILWQILFERFKVHIDFARRPFRYYKEGNARHVVVGFSNAPSERPKIIFDGKNRIEATNINAYLLDGKNLFFENQLLPLSDVPEIHRGNQPTDGGNLIIKANELEDFLEREPSAKKYVRRFMMSSEFLNDKKRYCLWLVGATPEEIDRMPLVKARIEAVKKFREASSLAKTRRMARRPHLFREQITPEHFIVVPKVTIGHRKYFPMGWSDSSIVAGDQLFMIDGAELYHFGVLESSVHMAWVRAMCNRFGVSRCYSKTLVYNNFIWCEPTESQRERISQTAQAILDVRAQHPDRTLAELYHPKKMPEDLLEAHHANDLAVLDAYGFDRELTEDRIVERLLKMYTDVWA